MFLYIFLVYLTLFVSGFTWFLINTAIVGFGLVIPPLALTALGLLAMKAYSWYLQTHIVVELPGRVVRIRKPSTHLEWGATIVVVAGFIYAYRKWRQYRHSVKSAESRKAKVKLVKAHKRLMRVLFLFGLVPASLCSGSIGDLMVMLKVIIEKYREASTTVMIFDDIFGLADSFMGDEDEVPSNSEGSLEESILESNEESDVEDSDEEKHSGDDVKVSQGLGSPSSLVDPLLSDSEEDLADSVPNISPQLNIIDNLIGSGQYGRFGLGYVPMTPVYAWMRIKARFNYFCFMCYAFFTSFCFRRSTTFKVGAAIGVAVLLGSILYGGSKMLEGGLNKRSGKQRRRAAYRAKVKKHYGHGDTHHLISPGKNKENVRVEHLRPGHDVCDLPTLYSVKATDKGGDVKTCAYVVGDFLVVPRHGASGFKEVVVYNDGKWYPLDGSAHVCRSMPDQLWFKLPKGVKWIRNKYSYRTPVKGELVSLHSVDHSSHRPVYTTGLVGDTTYVGKDNMIALTDYDSSSKSGMCGGVYISQTDNCVVGFHGVGSAKVSTKPQFYPMTKSWDEERAKFLNGKVSFNYTEDFTYPDKWEDVINNRIRSTDLDCLPPNDLKA